MIGKTLVALLLLFGLAPAVAEGKGPARPAGAVRAKRPVRSVNPDIWTPGWRPNAAQRKLGRYIGYNRGVKAFIARTGARSAPAFYQRFVNRAVMRAELALQRGGLSLNGLDIFVLEGGIADGLNATSWTGGILTFNRDLIDRSFDIASAVESAGSEAEVTTNLYKLAQWERSGGRKAKPKFRVKSKAKRDTMAEGLFMGVVLHETTHAFLHSPGPIENDDVTLWTPERQREAIASGSRAAAASRASEAQADVGAMEVALAGGSPDPAAYTLFFRYVKVLRSLAPSSRFSGAVELGDTETHPADDDRIRIVNEMLGRAGLANPYQPGDPGKLWVPPQRKLIRPSASESNATRQ